MLILLIKERKPKAWFMGHSHEFLYRKIHDTIFLRNPLGYPSEYGKFNGFFIFDTDKLELTHSDVKE